MKLAIIGGSLLGDLPKFAQQSQERIKTPFGEPSDNITTGKINECEMVYINRHGHAHYLPPHQINYRANMFALKMLDVTHVIAVTAVGGITEKMSPMRWVVPDQIIDYTYGRIQTYNDGNEHEVNHIDFTYPFDEDLRKQLIAVVENNRLKCISQATYGATQGPRLETMAEIKRLERDGCDIVGMTAMPEAALAKELEMNYAAISLVVNWAAGKGQKSDGIISMQEIKQHISDGNIIIEKIMNDMMLLLSDG